MFKGQDLTEVRRVEETLLRLKNKNAAFDLTNLVAIFTRRDNESWLPVFNIENPSDALDIPEILILEELLQDTRNLLADYDGIVITFDALRLVRRDIVTRGSRFYPI